MFQAQFNVTKKFVFEQQKVQKAVDRAERKAMTKGLAFIRLVSRRSIRRRKKASAPGSPPSAHSRSKVASLKAIFFDYDVRKKDGVVGPLKLNQRKQTGVEVDTTAPNILEFAGTMKISEQTHDGVTWFRQRRRRRKLTRKVLRTRTRRVKIQERPFMDPALKLANEKGKILGPWKGAVTG